MKVNQLFEAKEKSFKTTKEKVGRFTVETWWDKRTRDWVTQITDEKGYEVDNIKTGIPISSERGGTKDWAKQNHENMIKLAKTLK